MRKVTLALSVLFVLVAMIFVSGYTGEQMASGKSKYFVKTTHTPEQCLSALEEISKTDPKLISKFQWACKSGDHTGYAILEGDSESGVMNKLPPSARSNAKIQKVDNFTPEQIAAMHKQMMQKQN